MIPLALGTLELDTTSTRLDKKKVHRQSVTIDVVPPERLGLRCVVLQDVYPQETYVPCGPRGVPAARPLVVPEIIADGREQWSTLLRVNGAPRFGDRLDPPLSLAELFPDARDGDGVKPGNYIVELELEGMRRRFRVDAR